VVHLFRCWLRATIACSDFSRLGPLCSSQVGALGRHLQARRTTRIITSAPPPGGDPRCLLLIPPAVEIRLVCAPPPPKEAISCHSCAVVVIGWWEPLFRFYRKSKKLVKIVVSQQASQRCRLCLAWRPGGSPSADCQMLTTVTCAISPVKPAFWLQGTRVEYVPEQACPALNWRCFRTRSATGVGRWSSAASAWRTWRQPKRSPVYRVACTRSTGAQLWRYPSIVRAVA